MKGWLLTNGFLHTAKFTEIHIWLIESAKKLGIELIVKTNTEVMAVLDTEDFRKNKKDGNIDFVLFWDKDVRLAKYLERKGYPVFNSSKAIEICDDKALTHMYLQGAGIFMPRTLIAPMTFSNIGYTNLDFLKTVTEKLSFPIVVKECFGSFGQQVYLASKEEQLKELVLKTGSKPMLFQEFVKNSSGRDIRLQVVGGKVVAAMYRYSVNGDFRANVTNGGKMKPYEPTKQQIELAIQCCKILELDFGGVDMLFGENQEPVICEVNSNAHFKNIFNCTGINVADCIMEYIVKRICIG